MEEWRLLESLKLIRQCVVCPACGALVSTEAGIKTHTQWHERLGDKVTEIDGNFKLIDVYVRGEDGLEEKIIAAFEQTNASVTKLREDATAAIGQLRSDATNAITGLSNRVTAIENRPANNTNGQGKTKDV